MTKIFIAGSISINYLHQKVKSRIDNIISSGFDIIIGDARGVDTSIQKYLHKRKVKNVTVYCTGNSPRNNIGGWDVKKVESKHPKGSRKYYTAKDIEMALDSDYGLMIWDSQSSGTLSNVLELIRKNKKVVVFINELQKFITIVSTNDLENLLSFMTDRDRQIAINKIYQ